VEKRPLNKSSSNSIFRQLVALLTTHTHSHFTALLELLTNKDISLIIRGRLNSSCVAQYYVAWK